MRVAAFSEAVLVSRLTTNTPTHRTVARYTMAPTNACSASGRKEPAGLSVTIFYYSYVLVERNEITNKKGEERYNIPNSLILYTLLLVAAACQPAKRLATLKQEVEPKFWWCLLA
ncbi:Os03g0119232 [Oryza sativa Japonica Group]|uniref:Os03g0119232 protein n=1 Tax=Oryza sativa subsp. japonica TaxID=39947 RepID=A0A0P0VSA8_ORYSJ|nr:Os03g0119232 [Oryza sativa Japonica Group]